MIRSSACPLRQADPAQSGRHGDRISYTTSRDIIPLPRAEDEIALSDLLRIIWSGRALIVLIPLLAMAATALAIGALSLRIDEPTVYFVELRGIENSRYPN